MANLRTLKKNVAFVADEIITTLCYKNAVDATDSNKISELIVKTISAKNEIIARANHIDAKDDRKAVKKYFKALYKDFSDAVTEIVAEVNKI